MSISLKKRSYQVYVFSYRSVSHSMYENAQQLCDFVRQHNEAGAVNHFVGHSLGGLLIRQCHALNPDIFTGRIVTLGTPHQGSLVARRVAEDIYEEILGGAYENALDGVLPPWHGEVELGSIAGTQCVGIGMALHDLPKPNDGTVSVAETRLKNQTDHITLPLSHTSLVFSSRVVERVDTFLRFGHFGNDELLAQ